MKYTRKKLLAKKLDLYLKVLFEALNNDTTNFHQKNYTAFCGKACLTCLFKK